MPGAVLRIVGDGDDRRGSSEKAAALDLGDHVICSSAGSTTRRCSASTQRCTAFVMPSRDEGFGFVFVEAMRAARACVGAAARPARSSPTARPGWLVAAGDRAQLREAVVRCCAIAPATDGDGRARPRAVPAAVHRRAVSRPLHALLPLAAPVADRRMNILGLNAYHGDVSAALVRDGQLVAAVEEERYRRIKHCAGFPRHAMRACLEMGGIAPADVDVFAVSRDPRAHLWRKAWFLLRHRPKGTVASRARNMASLRALPGDARRRARRSTRRACAPRMRFVEHHPAHLASAAFVSPFDEAAVCAIDGFGDFVSTSWGRVAGSRHRRSTATSSFRTRSACCTWRSRSTSAFPTTATSSR